MKVQIIQLDAHDDYISTRDKMGWIQTGRIVLVWPPRGRILSRKLDLVLLQRHSKVLGVVIALVTGDSDVIHHAHQLGIPIFTNVRQALESPWRSKRRRVVRVQHNRLPINIEALRDQAPSHPKILTTAPKIRIGAFIVSLLAIIALISLFIPSAHLTLVPNHKTQEIKMVVAASPSFTEINIAGEIPARSMTTIVEGKDGIITTGWIRIPDQYAIGRVRFINLSKDQIEIPEGTIVSTLGTDPVRFETSKSGEIFGGIGESVSIPIKALFPGDGGNVPAENILAIEGSLGLTISVTNPMPTQNGAQTTVPAASTKDRSMLYLTLLDILEDTALLELKSQLNPGDLMIDDTLKPVKILEESYAPPEHQPSNQLELSLQVEYEALTLERNDIHYLANLVLDANLPEGYQAIPDTLDVQPENKPTIGTDRIIHWQMIMRRDIVAIIDPDQVINMTLGLPVSQASLIMEDRLDLMKPPIITHTPDWWSRIPFLPFRVQVSYLELP